MGSVQAAMASPAESLVVSDFMMADEMEDFVGHSGSDGPVANEILALRRIIQFDRRPL
jgi:hypothetical protein